MSTTEKLAELNALRTAKGQPPLKSWKGSVAALDQTLVAYKTKKVAPAVAEGAYPTAKQAEHATGLKGTDAKARDAIAKANKPKAGDPVKGAKDSGAFELRRVKPDKSQRDTLASVKALATGKGKTKHVSQPTGKASDLVSLADIARELKIEPKLARAKARRSEELTKLAKAAGGESWAFKPADAATVKKLLKS